MAPGFFAKLGDIAKKVWSGVKTVAKGAAKYGAPILKEVGKVLGGVPNPTAQGISKGLTAIQPVISRLLSDE